MHLEVAHLKCAGLKNRGPRSRGVPVTRLKCALEYTGLDSSSSCMHHEETRYSLLLVLNAS